MRVVSAVLLVRFWVRSPLAAAADRFPGSPPGAKNKTASPLYPFSPHSTPTPLTPSPPHPPHPQSKTTKIQKQAALGGKANPSADDVKAILGAAGVEAPAADVERLLKELEGKSLEDLLKAGREKLQSVPSGAVAAAPAAGGGGGGGGGGKGAEKKEEEPEEEDEDMGFSLFD
jgi:large subunit ribosomal protein LP2